MDKSIILQQKVRDNSKSLQDEFFDLKFWEEEMKKNDKKIQDTKAGKDEVNIQLFMIIMLKKL